MVRLYSGFGLGLILATTAAVAQTDMPAQGRLLLTVSGQIAPRDLETGVALDRAALSAMGLVQIRTSTQWTKGIQLFEGVPLAQVLASLGAQGKVIRATALNDYSVDIPVDEIAADAPLLALRMNGVDLSVRDKGPIWLVYPYDASVKYQSDVIYARSIWQVVRLEVIP